MLLPLLVACGDDTTNKNDNGDKYVYDDLTRETAADCIPDDYDLKNQTISIAYTRGADALIGNSESTDIVYSKIYERNLNVQERLNVKLEFVDLTGGDYKELGEKVRREIQTMSAVWEILFSTNNSVISLYNYFHNLTDAEYLELGKKSDFTMQQIYDVVITMYSEEKDADELLHCTYELKYKIHMNNGTLRNDMGSDCYRVQQIIMLENKDTEELEIITVNTFSDRTAESKPIIWKAILAIAVSAVFIAAVIVVSVKYIKKTESNENTEEKTDDENKESRE